jgi:hypothetical protein
MTRHAAPDPFSGRNEAGRQVAQLRHLLGLVEQVAGRGAGAGQEAALDEAARVSAAYEAALPLARRRFDAVAAETAAWSAAGVEAIAAAGAAAPQAAAGRLADELSTALAELIRLIDPATPSHGRRAAGTGFRSRSP